MKVSELWLREWVNPELDAEGIAAQLTMAGLEVDALSNAAGDFSGVVVAEVLETKPHPQADKLTLCLVNAGDDEPVDIVCGAANVRAGLKVALATIGAVLPGNFKIKKAKLRGEPSMGMLCSVSELGMADASDGIMELAEDAPVGLSLREYLGLDDKIYDIDLTPNRADCFSVKGIARELSALNRMKLNAPDISVVKPSIDDSLKLSLEASEACARYCGRVIRGISSNARTPVWMAERLRRAGIRQLHPVVDVTNYVMLELGQPMHAFDLNKIGSDQVVVRQSRENECIELLDGRELTLDKQVLLISNGEKPLAMAGIMGGQDSAVEEETTDIFLESAFFNPLAISGVARHYGLCTDSSQRYERGVDWHLQMDALERASALILEIVGGQAGPVVEAVAESHLPKAAVIQFKTEKVKRLTGMDIPFETIKQSLLALGMDVKTVEEGKTLEVKAPSHRFDIAIEEDLVEEVLRLFGYQNLTSGEVMMPMQPGQTNSDEDLIARISSWFANRAYRESISYSFVDPELQSLIYPDTNKIDLLNPISAELSQMRSGMWPGLIASMVYNLHRQQHSIRLFETGVSFDKKDGEIVEKAVIAGLMTGECGGLNWSEPTRHYDFYDVKGDIEALFKGFSLGLVQFKTAEHPALHPGRSADIYLNDQLIGRMGVLHPALSEQLDAVHDVVLFEIELAAFKMAKSFQYKRASKYPMIRRDLSLLVNKTIPASAILQVIRQVVDAELLKSLDVFDLYEGKGIPEGQKSLALAIYLQHSERTLVDNEINEILSAILKKLETDFAITLRE